MSSSKKYSNGYWKVYVHINMSNNKRYVGITSQKVEYRWNYGKAYLSNKYFISAINKYGWDGFEHIVLFDGLTKEEAQSKEIELIKQWDTTNRLYGYNITLGGEGTNGFNPPPELRQKWSEIRKGFRHTEETKKKMSESTSLRRPDVRKKSAEAKFKPVCAYSLNDEYIATFDSIIGAAKEFGLSNAQRAHISDCCNGTRRSTGGYKWKYA